MPYIKGTKCKHTCKHCVYDQNKGWICELYIDCILCNYCPNHEWKENEKEKLL